MDTKQTEQTSKTRFSFTLNRSRIVFVIVMCLAVLAVVWPGHEIFSDPLPLIFGFPLSFAWVIAWVLISFAAMMGLYISDNKFEDNSF